MDIRISPERPDTPDARTLIGELDDLLGPLYPVESRFGYTVDKLLAQGVDFYVIRADGTPAGCGGIQFFDEGFGELKRMYVRPQFRGNGLARKLLEELENHARGRGIKIIRLETGIHQTEAIRLYERAGFRQIPAFGEYTDTPTSRCYEKRLIGL